MATLSIQPVRQSHLVVAFAISIAVSFLAGARFGGAMPGAHEHAAAPVQAVACEGTSTGPGTIGVAETTDIGADCNTNLR
jgi:hypothetical protein